MAGGETRVRDAVPTVSLEIAAASILSPLCVRACAHARARARAVHALRVRAGQLRRGRVGGGAAAVVLVWVTPSSLFIWGSLACLPGLSGWRSARVAVRAIAPVCCPPKVLSLKDESVSNNKKDFELFESQIYKVVQLHPAVMRAVRQP